MRVKIWYAMVFVGLLAFGWPSSSQAAETKFDGTYSGHKIQTSGKGCSTAGDITMQVKDGVFMWGVKPSVSPITISSAGVIDGSSGQITIKGNATATGMEFDSTTSGCFNKWHFDKKR